MALGTSRLTINHDIPEEVICYTIFSRLPFKLVTCLKTVSKQCCKQLKDDTIFAAKQTRLCPSCPALIYIGCFDNTKDPFEYSLEVISSTTSIVGIPSPELDFLGCPIDKGNFDILASSNGLLCIRYTPYRRGSLTPPHTIFIANPATQQAQPIPGAAQHLLEKRAVGLVFDPSDEPSANAQRFKIIQAFPFVTTNDTFVELHFVTFSSDTGRWVMSKTTINENIKLVTCRKVVYASGVLYWDYLEDLVWFDVTVSAAGVIKMPKKLQGSTYEEWEHHSIDASNNGILMCTTIDKDCLAMYQLVKRGSYCWDLKHNKTWKDILEISGDTIQFCHSMKLRNGWRSEFCERWVVTPLGLESGRWVYLSVRPKWKLSERILRYDIDTSKLNDIGKKLGNALGMKSVFGYRNSMAALPPIDVPILENGICDGKPGGCICAIEGSED